MKRLSRAERRWLRSTVTATLMNRKKRKELGIEKILKEGERAEDVKERIRENLQKDIQIDSLPRINKDRREVMEGVGEVNEEMKEMENGDVEEMQRVIKVAIITIKECVDAEREEGGQDSNTPPEER